MIAGRNAYLGSMVSTASPARLLVLLYDRLVLDLQRALEAQTGGDHPSAGTHLLHAQEIVLELQSSLDIEAWDGAGRLFAIYAWLYREMVRANVQRDLTVTQSCIGLVGPLAEAWRGAALAAAEL
jgi:flagellar secretion chaperone FliS